MSRLSIFAFGSLLGLAVVTVPERLELGGNFMVVAAKRPIPGERIVSEAAGLDLEVTVLTGEDLDAFIDGAEPLTDDFAPVDQLLATS